MRSVIRSFVIMLTLLTASAFAYEVQRSSPDGAPLRWKSKKIELSISSSLAEKIGGPGSAGEVREAVVRAAREWGRIAGIQFVLRDTEDLSVSPAGKRGNGISLVTVAPTAENLLLFSGDNSDSPAFTRVFFDERNHIVEADIVLNPYLLFSTDGNFGAFDLRSTLMHELGHLLGLGHSGIPGATMNPVSARNGLYSMPFHLFRSLSSDDIAGVHRLYGSAGFADCCGILRGQVSEMPDSAAGLEVWIEDSASGEVEAEATIGENAKFDLEGIPSGEYTVYARSGGSTSAVAASRPVRIAKDGIETFDSFELVRKRSASISFVGLNGQLSQIAVPVNRGRAYRIYLGGSGNLSRYSIKTSSPAIRVDDSSVEVLDYGKEISVISFVVDVGKDVQNGEYSIRLYDKQGIVDVLPGSISVEEDNNPWFVREL